MNTIKQIIIPLIIILGIGIFLLLTNKSSSPSIPRTKNTGTSVIIENDTVVQDSKMSTGTKYILYSNSQFNESIKTRRVLFFYANWCPTCITANKSFEINARQIPENVTVLRVNYNDSDTDEDEKELAKKYGITYQHTFVQIDANGDELAKWNGGDVEELLSNIK